MASRKLTSGFARTATVEEGEKDRTIYWDEGLSGFGLMVTPTGHRSYIAQYRANGKSRRVTVANAEKVELEAARKIARKLFGDVAAGADPVVDKRNIAQTDTLQAVCERYLSRKKELRSIEKKRADLVRLVYPVLGSRPIADIRRRDINALLDKIQDERGAPMADLVLSLLRTIFNWYAV